MLEQLRQKPKHVRVQYAFWTALSVTALIFLLWGWSTLSRLAPQTPEVGTEVESSFFSQLSGFFMKVQSIPTLFKGTIEYENKVEDTPEHPTVIDLDALVASSTRGEGN
jgi:hypothetical protein